MDKQIYLDRVGKGCMKELDRIKIPYAKNSYFVPISKGRRFGRAEYTYKGYKISINDLLLDGLHDESLKEIVMHELLHTCKGCMNHGKQWLSYAAEVNAKLGYKVKQFYSCNEVGISERSYDRDIKYILQCNHCLHRIKRQKYTKAIYTKNGCTCDVCKKGTYILILNGGW